MPVTKKKKNGLLNGLVHDVYTSVGSTFIALFFGSIEEIAEKSVKQQIERQNSNGSNNDHKNKDNKNK